LHDAGYLMLAFGGLGLGGGGSVRSSRDAIFLLEAVDLVDEFRISGLEGYNSPLVSSHLQLQAMQSFLTPTQLAILLVGEGNALGAIHIGALARTLLEGTLRDLQRDIRLGGRQ
jgi:hypothetical protein